MKQIWHCFVTILFSRPLTGEEILEIINNCVGSMYNPTQFSPLTKKQLVFLWAVGISFFSLMIWWLICLVSRYFICMSQKIEFFDLTFSLQSPFFRTMLIRKALVSTLTVCNLRMILTADSPFSLNCKVVHVWIVVSFGSTLKLHWYIFNQNKIDSFPATVLFLLLMIVLSSVCHL